MAYSRYWRHTTRALPHTGRHIRQCDDRGVIRIAPRGIQKFNWIPVENTFEKSWANMTVDNTDVMVPHVSSKSKVLYAANKVGLRYEYVGLDWETGALKGRWTFPSDREKHHERYSD